MSTLREQIQQQSQDYETASSDLKAKNELIQKRSADSIKNKRGSQAVDEEIAKLTESLKAIEWTIDEVRQERTRTSLQVDDTRVSTDHHLRELNRLQLMTVEQSLQIAKEEERRSEQILMLA